MKVLGLRIEREHNEGPSRLQQLWGKLSAAWPKWTALTLLVWVLYKFLWWRPWIPLEKQGAFWKYDYIRSHFVWPMIALLIVFAIVLFAMENRAPQAQGHHGGDTHEAQPAEAAAPADAAQTQQAAPAAQPAAQSAANPAPNPAPQAHG